MTQAVTDPRAAVLDHIKELPPLPVVVHQLVAVMQDDECSADEINRILSSDQALASKVLRLVNSSFYGLPGRVSTIPRAVVILGHAALRNLATALGVVGSVGGRLPPAQRQVFWRHALATAAGAEVIGRRVGIHDAEEAFIAGLLHDIGHLILMLAVPGGHAQLEAAGCLGDVEYERATIGLDHCRAGRQLLQHWKLPAPLLECVRLHHAPEVCAGGGSPLLTTVALADRLSRLVDAAGEAAAADDDAPALAGALGLSAADALRLVPEIRARMLEARSFLTLAAIEAGLPAPDGEAGTGRAVVVSGDAARRDWLAAVAAHHGRDPLDLRDWLAAGAEAADVVVLWDGSTLDRAQAERLWPHIEATGVDARAIAPLGAAGHPGPAGPALSLTFSVDQLGLR